MTQTEQSLDRIFAICDLVAETGKAIRTEDEGREIERSWLGLPTRLAAMAKESEEKLLLAVDSP